jgi:hypothetical protein
MENCHYPEDCTELYEPCEACSLGKPCETHYPELPILVEPSLQDPIADDSFTLSDSRGISSTQFEMIGNFQAKNLDRNEAFIRSESVE